MSYLKWDDSVISAVFPVISDEDELLGHGQRGVVFLQDGLAVKKPAPHPWFGPSVNKESIIQEQKVYCRLQPSLSTQSEGIVGCVGFSEDATYLEYMVKGDLRTYLDQTEPSRELQFLWACQMARSLVYIHERRVLLPNIDTRNLLLDSRLRLKFSGFCQASILPLDAYIPAEGFQENTVKKNIGQLGAVIYEITTRKETEIGWDLRCIFPDLWPRRRFLPSTKDIWLGSIIDGCWADEGFQNAKSVLNALEGVEDSR